MSPRLTKACAVACYLLALAGGGAFVLRVLALGLGFDLELPLFSPPLTWLTDLALLVAFGLQHSIMARACFKQRWTCVVPPALERSVYSALSGLVLLVLSALWQPVGGVWWRLPLYLVVVPLSAAVALTLVNLRFDHAGLFGLRQAWAGGDFEPETLVVTGPYRYVRHPLMACLLVFFWTQPVMTTTLALLNGGMTLYIFVGLLFEERDLSQRFNPAYGAYRRRVPALIPWRPPVPPT